MDKRLILILIAAIVTQTCWVYGDDSSDSDSDSVGDVLSDSTEKDGPGPGDAPKAKPNVPKGDANSDSIPDDEVDDSSMEPVNQASDGLQAENSVDGIESDIGRTRKDVTKVVDESKELEKRNEDLTLEESLAIMEAGNQVLEVYFICDRRCHSYLQGGTDVITAFFESVTKRMDEGYANMKMSVKMIGLEIWDMQDQIDIDALTHITDTTQLEPTLSAMLADYKRDYITPKVSADFVMLVTGYYIPGLNGAAYMNAICRHPDKSVGFSYLDPLSFYKEAKLTQTITHETTHAMGAFHDTDECVCPIGAKNCTMHPIQNQRQINEIMFSDCTVGSLAQQVTNGNRYCLQDVSQPATCGNGQLDAGEECDCGFGQCDCCDQKTCKFRIANSRCSSDECGVCGGSSSECTSHLPDLTSCEDGGGYCYKKKCRSLKSSCIEYFGAGSTPDPTAMNYNNQYSYDEHNGGGYRLLDEKTGQWSAYKDFRKDSGNGLCGILECKSNKAGKIVHNGEVVPTVTYKLSWRPNTRIMYVRSSTTNWGTYVYRKFFPVTASMGTPCHTTDGKRGYCKNDSYQYDKWRWNWYWITKCQPINA